MMKLLFIVFLLFFNFSLTAQEIDTSGLYDQDFQTTADQLTEDLKARLTLTDQQADEIRDILIQYQEKVQSDYEPENSDQEIIEDTAYDATQTRVDGTETEAEPDLNTDTSFTEDPLSGFDDEETVNDNYLYAGEDPQKEANKNIEEVLNETQKTTWSIIREAWWRDVNSRYRWDNNSMQDFK
jgi:hypothetical protein